MAMLITFEGGEGSGKSTQARLLHQTLAQRGYDAILVREPGGTPLGDRLRAALADPDLPLSPLAELFLFLSARAELVERRVLPALRQGQIVIADRFADSTLAYQGYGRGLELGMLRYLNGLATGGLVPDLTLFLDVSPEEGLRRRHAPQCDRFEREASDFHHRVRQGYLELAAADPKRWCVIDGTEPPDVVARRVWAKVEPLVASRVSQ